VEQRRGVNKKESVTQHSKIVLKIALRDATLGILGKEEKN
jgi:hypothetical protein